MKAPSISGPLRLIEIRLPSWAADCGVNGELLVPVEVVENFKINDETWRYIDWWLAAFLLLEAWHERIWESRHGTIHSYSFRLKGWDKRAWERAWVNRIGLFLRSWVIECGHKLEAKDLKPLPKFEIRMSHDVDAIQKTVPIRLKQGCFNLFNAGRGISRGELAEATSRVKEAFRFFLGHEDWWLFEPLLELERENGVRATFHFYAESEKKSLKSWFFDPGYDVREKKLRVLLQNLKAAGHQVGLHPGYDTWNNAKKIKSAKKIVEKTISNKITSCRQHWLRFSWRDTWNAQSLAGLSNDSTLMFNDRPGFRNSSALAWNPYNQCQLASHKFSALPTVFMDSHFYDYKPMSVVERQAAIRYWIKECQVVNGVVSVLWHPHTLSQDYGWYDGFEFTTRLISDSKFVNSD